MANTIKVKRSAVPGKTPTTGDLQLGELAINTYDGKLYTKKDNGVVSIVELTGSGGSSNCTEDTFTGDGTTTAWTLSKGVLAAANLLVSVSPTNWSAPEILTTASYTVSGTTLTITPAVSSGSQIRALHLLGAGATGATGATGAGVPVGGTTGQLLRKVSATNYDTEWATITGVTDGNKGDITVSGSGATWSINAGVVTNADLVNVATATFKGRATAGTGSPEDLTGTQATALLDVFSSTLKGLVPASGGGTASFLRADGWSTTLTAPLRPPAGTTSAAPLVLTSGTNLTANTAGAVEYDGSFAYLTPNTTSGRAAVPTLHTFRLTSNGSSIGGTIADYFGATSSINLVAGGVYEFLFHVYLTKNTGGSLTWTLTASSAPTLITGHYVASPLTGIAAGTPLTSFTGSQGATTAAFATTSSVSAGVQMSFMIRGTVIANAATDFRLRITCSAGTVTPLAGSFYEVRRVSPSVGVFAA